MGLVRLLCVSRAEIVLGRGWTPCTGRFKRTPRECRKGDLSRIQKEIITMRHFVSIFYILTGCAGLASQLFTGTNAPGGSTNFTFTIGAGATNLALVLPGTGSAYSYVFVRKGAPATESSYDFSSQVSGDTNALYLEQPEVAPGTYYVHVSTPVESGLHNFSLNADTNQPYLRTAARPVTKPLNGLAAGLALRGVNEYFRVELTTSTLWRVALDSTNSVAPDLYIAQDQLPTTGTYLQRSVNVTNDLLAMMGAEGSPGVYYIGVFGASAPNEGANYTLQIAPIVPVTLNWDPGLTHLGTEVYTNTSGEAGDYYFRVTTANPALAAWRTALRVVTTNGDADVYLSRSVLPVPTAADYHSTRPGSDGMIRPSLSEFSRPAGTTIQFKISADANQTYVVEASSDLKVWETVGSAVTLSDGTAVYQDSTVSGVNRRFYRVRLP